MKIKIPEYRNILFQQVGSNGLHLDFPKEDQIKEELMDLFSNTF